MRILLQVSTLQGHHQASIMNHFIKKLRTFLGSQSMFTSTKQVRVFIGIPRMYSAFFNEMVHDGGLMMTLQGRNMQQNPHNNISVFDGEFILLFQVFMTLYLLIVNIMFRHRNGLLTSRGSIPDRDKRLLISCKVSKPALKHYAVPLNEYNGLFSRS